LGPPLQANCPNCGEPNLNSYFGDILTVAGPRDKNTVKCPCCSSTLEFDAQKRAVLVSEAASS
jgi:RNA polymerase subunit RPABC4/transcription elongation factor Spt4